MTRVHLRSISPQSDVTYSGGTRGGQEGTSAPGRSTLRRQIEVGMLRTNYEMSNVSGC